MRPERVGGVMACGASAAGRRQARGMVRNLDVQEGELGALLVSFEFDSPLPPDCFYFPVYTDGVPRSTALPGQALLVDPLGDGGHEVEVLPVRVLGGIAPILWGDVRGRRVLLAWSRAAEADVVAYEVGWDAGDAGASSPTVLARVEEMRTDRVVEAAGATGGRVSVRGSWQAEARNGLLTLAVSEEGDALLWTLSQGAEELAAGEVTAEAAQTLISGLVVVWHDALEDYGAGDEWEFWLGPHNQYLTTEELAGDTYRFAVRVVDAAGNASDWSSWRSVAVEGGPEAPADAAIEWDAATRTVRATWTDPAGATASQVLIYINYNSLFERLEDYVLEEGEIAAVSLGVEEYELVLPEGVNGEVLAYVRTRNTAGVIERNARLLRATATAEVVATLAAPLITEVAAAAGGALSAAWQVNIEEATPAALVFYSSQAGSWDDAVEEEVAWDDLGAEGFPLTAGMWTSSNTFGTAQYLAVRAKDGAGNLTPQGDWVGPAMPDASAPAAVSITSAAAV